LPKRKSNKSSNKNSRQQQQQQQQEEFVDAIAKKMNIQYHKRHVAAYRGALRATNIKYESVDTPSIESELVYVFEIQILIDYLRIHARNDREYSGIRIRLNFI
jgi:hypothetical protein